MSRRPAVRQSDIERACRAVLKATGVRPIVIAYPDGRVSIVPADPSGITAGALGANDDEDRQLAELEAKHGEG